MEIRHLKLMGDVGHIHPLKFDVKDRNSVNKAIGPSNIVINCLGMYRETINYSYHDINAKAAQLIAECAQAAGVERLVHVSALGADENSSSSLYKSKAIGEKLVLDAFPNATIVRPSPIFGPEDRLLMRFAALIHYSNEVPLLTRDRMYQPVWVGDVAAAIAAAIVNPDTKGKIYELGGPEVYTDYLIAGMMCEAMFDHDLRKRYADDDFEY